MTRFVFALAAVCLLTGIAAAAPTLDDQVYAIARELMCPVCSGQTVAESNSALAQQMRDEIRRRLVRGESEEQILAYFVGQFGESVLATPPRSGAGLAVWLTPVFAFLIGAVILVRFLQRARTHPGTAHREPGHEREAGSPRPEAHP